MPIAAAGPAGADAPGGEFAADHCCGDLAAIFDTIYAADLVYEAGCWQRCGDAHCCSFQRYKAKFRMMARTPFQELPLLPGEYRYLSERGLTAQFGDHEHRVVEVALDGFTLRGESVVSRRPGCACDHGTRTTVCRLYPLLPRFAPDGRLLDVERLGIYEEMEAIGGLPPACRLTAIPFAQMTPLLAITSALARSPWLLFHLEAYRLTKRQVAARLGARLQARRAANPAAAADREPFATFEAGFLRRDLIDAAALRAELSALVRAFDDQHGPGWRRQDPAAHQAMPQ